MAKTSYFSIILELIILASILPNNLSSALGEIGSD